MGAAEKLPELYTEAIAASYLGIAEITLRRIRALIDASPKGDDRDQLGDLVEGMSVSIDVDRLFNTDGRRLFGTVTTVQHDDSEKGGLTLLVQDAQPNWDASPKGAILRNDGNSEAQFIADSERLDCPACGGSGHADDSPKGGSDAGMAAALHAAVGAIYFNDRSDYLPVLWTVVRTLNPEIAVLLERDAAAAYDATAPKATSAEVGS